MSPSSGTPVSLRFLSCSAVLPVSEGHWEASIRWMLWSPYSSPWCSKGPVSTARIPPFFHSAELCGSAPGEKVALCFILSFRSRHLELSWRAASKTEDLLSSWENPGRVGAQKLSCSKGPTSHARIAKCRRGEKQFNFLRLIMWRNLLADCRVCF